jgi:hypothetical protein
MILKDMILVLSLNDLPRQARDRHDENDTRRER